MRAQTNAAAAAGEAPRQSKHLPRPMRHLLEMRLQLTSRTGGCCCCAFFWYVYSGFKADMKRFIAMTALPTILKRPCFFGSSGCKGGVGAEDDLLERGARRSRLLCTLFVAPNRVAASR